MNINFMCLVDVMTHPKKNNLLILVLVLVCISISISINISINSNLMKIYIRLD